MSRHTLNFVDLFDWEVESDRHYISMLQGPHFDEVEEQKGEAEIVVIHKNKNNGKKSNKRALPGASKKRLQS